MRNSFKKRLKEDSKKMKPIGFEKINSIYVQYLSNCFLKGLKSLNQIRQDPKLY